tara:strand:+ start:300 stop:791 length:492 start_codon:yes stop_codon:yes gene_type:complete
MSLPTLYELADEFKDALENLTDLDDQAVIDTLESLEGEFKLKSTNVAKYIKNLENILDGMKEAESNMRQRRVSLEKKIHHMREYLRNNLEKSGIKQIDAPDISISMQKNPYKVVINNENEIPEDFIDTKETKTVNKEKIKEALKDGKEVPGCELVQENRITIK